MQVITLTKRVAEALAGSVTQTTKMPCKSYSLPTVACKTGFKMAQLPGSICASCYAMKGNYHMYAANIEPAQHARLDSVMQALDNVDYAVAWVDSMAAHIGTDAEFRWHDSGDLQSVDHLRLIARVCDATPDCAHWLPTREYAMVKQYIEQFGALPANLVVRLSAMYVDKPVIVPASLQNVPGVEVSNVHKNSAPVGQVCSAPANGGKCGDCRLCFGRTGAVSYAFH